MMSNLSTVINFEVRRAVKKKSFWYASFAPVIIVLVVTGITRLSTKNATKSNQQQTQAFSQTGKIAVLDDSKLLNQQELTGAHIVMEPSKDAGIQAVKTGQLDAFFYYPANVSQQGIEVYAQDKGLAFTPYDAAAIQLLKQGVISTINATAGNRQVVQILQKNPTVSDVTYKNGTQTQGLASIIAPGIFAAAFFVLIVLLSYFMISIATEEKENRAAEILLTAIKSKTLVLGKITSILVLGLIQLLAIIVPLLVGFTLFKNHISLPGNISLSQIPLNPVAIIFGALFLVFGVLMFASLLGGLGSLLPSVQEGGRFVGIFIIFAILPIYSIQLVLSSPDVLTVRVFSYFPLTAPTTALLRNAVGNISTGQLLVSLVIVIVSAILAVLFAMRAFRYGALEYGRRISVKELFRK